MSMGFLQSLRIALSCLAANKLRSVLTMLGVIIGVAAVIAMVAIIEGLRYQVLKEFEAMGSRLIIVAFMPQDRERVGGGGSGEWLTLEDADAMLHECPLVSDVSPELTMYDRTFESEGQECTGQVVGGLATYGSLHNIELEEGRFFSQEQCDSWARVCVVGPTVREKLWPDGDALGRSLQVHGINFTVIGVAAHQARSMGQMQAPDANIYAPITTLHKRIAGDDRVWTIYAQAADTDQTDEAADQIWALLMRRHRNQPDFLVDTQSRLVETVNRLMAIFAVVFGGIAGLSLLVGGIGIMNIMLVSVTERTREIGLRKAVGAKRRHIMMQFLTEAATLSGIGGILGIAFGVGISWVVRAATHGDLPTRVPVWVAAFGFCFACAVGIFFGLYPAWRAARLDPIQALRHE
jgi:putative ABC transport system permease protein